MFRISLFALIIFSSPVFAVSLFGVDLQQATRDTMRNAVKQNGAILVKEAGKDGFFDEYDSQKLLPGSSRLYLGYEKKDNQIAFAEYTFDGLDQSGLLKMLTAKYGKPQKTRAKYHSDAQYKWQADGVQIWLYQDWSRYKVRLMYGLPAKLSALRHDYQQFKISQAALQAANSELAY